MSFTIGEGSYIDGGQVNGSFVDQAKLHIGKYCSIARGLNVVLGGNHPMEWVSTYPFFTLFPELPQDHLLGYTKGDIVIGNDVWLGLNVTIMSGVTIGDGAVIAAYSVVAKDIPPYAIAAGNPGKVRKYRFAEDIRGRLLKMRWWDWPKEKIRGAVPLMNSKDIETFLDEYERNNLE